MTTQEDIKLAVTQLKSAIENLDRVVFAFANKDNDDEYDSDRLQEDFPQLHSLLSLAWGLHVHSTMTSNI